MVTLYPGPGINAGAANSPEPFDVMERISPRSSLEITTLAPGTAAPERSCTTPEIPATPAAAWPHTEPAASENSTAQANNLIFIEETFTSCAFTLETRLIFGGLSKHSCFV